MVEQGSGRSLAKRWSIWLVTGALILFSALLLPWWRQPALPHTFPPEVEQLDRQIYAAGVGEHFPNQYDAFHKQVSDLRQRWRVEANRWWPSWTLEEFTESYQQLMHSGDTLLAAAEKKKALRQDQLRDLLQAEQAQLARLRDLNGLFDLRGKRTTLSRAESFLSQGFTHLTQGRLDPVPHLLKQAQDAMHPIEAMLIQQMGRYTDRQNLDQWNRWVTEAIEHSRHSRSLVIVVIKASQELRVYQNGLLRHDYPTNLGFSGLQDKLYEGDGATPEGIFQVVQKKRQGETKFHKALMLNFPTPLNQRRFRVAKAQGLVPANRGIGGLIEIHGQQPGQRDLTNGCIALDNSIMDKLFSLVPLKTPVIIVGTLDPINSVSKALRLIQLHRTQRESLAMSVAHTSSRLSIR